jgi:MinD-like ATPase involved in chromosome partitioning or flagellar assembly
MRGKEVSNRKIISVHSYRGGTGKSNTTANIAVCAMLMGKRVAVLDTDLQSPGIHVPFGINQTEIRLTLVDFLWGKCSIEETAYDVTQRISPGAKGKCWLVPASLTTHAIAKIIDEGYDVNNLNSHFDDLLEALDLDYLLIDTHPGLNRETMLTTAISDTLIILIRPDQQDYYGTAVLSEIAKKLEIPSVYLVVNKIFSYTDQEQLQSQLTQTFGYEVIGMIPLSEDLARLESRDIFVQVNPNHEISHILRAITEKALE